MVFNFKPRPHSQDLPGWTPVLLLCLPIMGPTTLGNVVLRDSGFEALRGHRVFALANPTSIFPDTLE